MLPKKWSIAKILHLIYTLFLPNYRSVQLIGLLLIEKKTGLTTFIIDDHIDTGLFY